MEKRTHRKAGHIMLYLLYEMDELLFVKGKKKKVNTLSKVCVYLEGKVWETDDWRGFYYEENSIK